MGWDKDSVITNDMIEELILRLEGLEKVSKN
jgi:hypothetical protein